jgi:coenzyme F420-reducing hydrogenase alpha subunit
LGKTISIDPITRLEGHGKIDMFLDDTGNVEKAYLQVPELRGFENFVKGRLAEGVGIVEAPRGTLIHHYKTDERGIITACNLIVASLGNSAAMCLSVEKASKRLIKNGEVNEGLLNMVEMAFRAYDPCFGCATHFLPGKMPLKINLLNRYGVKQVCSSGKETGKSRASDITTNTSGP